ncbi:MAG: acylphosphatase [Pseudomonadota bacterium]
MTERIARRLVIAGRVQGVGYRDWLVAEARAAGLAGWVRNRDDGTVEALIAGPTSALDAIQTCCGRGPRFASVDYVAAEEAEAADAPSPFARRPTD